MDWTEGASLSLFHTIVRNILAFVLLITSAAQAQSSDVGKTQDIQKFFKLTNVAELAFADIANNLELQRRANPDVPEKFWKELLMGIKQEEFLARILPIYDKHFSHEEIKAWVAFFESKPGQAFLKNQRVVLEESAKAGQAYVEEVSGPILQRLEKK